MPIERSGHVRRGFAVAATLAASCLFDAAPAQAQGDCSTGFECGRVAWGEYVRDGAQSYRLWLQDFDGARRTLLAHFGPSSGNFARGLRFDAASRHLYGTSEQVPRIVV